MDAKSSPSKKSDLKIHGNIASMAMSIIIISLSELLKIEIIKSIVYA